MLRNRKLATILAGVAVFMVGMAFAAVPLYELYCRVTGYGGTINETRAPDVLTGEAFAEIMPIESAPVQSVVEAPAAAVMQSDTVDAQTPNKDQAPTSDQAPNNDEESVDDSKITLFFHAHVMPGLPIEFTPLVPKMEVGIDEPVRYEYRARNLTSETISSQSIYNGTPHKAAIYLNKTECFCFSEYTFAPNEEVLLHAVVRFSPEIREDPNTREVRQFTVSYQFFPLETDLAAK